MPSWIEAHRESELAAIAAESAARSGNAVEAASLYAKAAKLEELALDVVPASKARTRGITGVSAAALWLKELEHERAEALARRLLDDPLVPEFAKGEFSRLIRSVFARHKAPPRGVRASSSIATKRRA